MAVIQSQIDTQGEDFARNREAMLAAVSGFREIEQKLLDKAAEAQAKFDSELLREARRPPEHPRPFERTSRAASRHRRTLPRS